MIFNNKSQNHVAYSTSNTYKRCYIFVASMQRLHTLSYQHMYMCCN
jgi:hypothetical protein